MGKQVRDYLNTNANPLFIDEVMGGEELTLRFGDPLKDTRTPDISCVRPTARSIQVRRRKMRSTAATTIAIQCRLIGFDSQAGSENDQESGHECAGGADHSAGFGT